MAPTAFLWTPTSLPLTEPSLSTGFSHRTTESTLPTAFRRAAQRCRRCTLSRRRAEQFFPTPSSARVRLPLPGCTTTPASTTRDIRRRETYPPGRRGINVTYYFPNSEPIP